MRSSRRWLVPGSITAVAFALAAGWLATNRPRGPQLPVPHRYDRLPVQFDHALARAREQSVTSHDPDAARALARLYQANRLFAEARACYLVVAARPGGLNAQDHYHLAIIAEDESNLAIAKTELKATLQGEPGYVPARLALAEVCFKSGEPDEAQQEYAAILATDANQPQASFGLARLELQRGDEKAAVARLKRLIAQHPESTSAGALLASLLNRGGHRDEAEALTARIQQTHEPVPPDPWRTALMVDCYDRLQLALEFEQYRLADQMDLAMPLLDRLAELDPHSWIPPMLRGWSQSKAGHPAEAAREYRQALEAGGDADKVCPLLVAALYAAGRGPDAVRLLAEQRAKTPHSLPILEAAAELAVRMGNEKLARELLNELLRAEPYLYLPNMSLVQILWNAGEREAAAVCLQRVVRVFPADLDSRGLLAQFYLEKSEPLAAIGPLEQAVAIAGGANPKRARLVEMLDTAYLMAGSSAAAAEKYPEAVSLADRSISLLPDDLRGYTLKAKVCRRSGDFRSAATTLERMISLEPAEPVFELNLGDALYLSGDKSSARRHWQHALEISPANAAAFRTATQQRLAGQPPGDDYQ